VPCPARALAPGPEPDEEERPVSTNKRQRRRHCPPCNEIGKFGPRFPSTPDPTRSQNLQRRVLQPLILRSLAPRYSPDAYFTPSLAQRACRHPIRHPDFALADREQPHAGITVELLGLRIEAQDRIRPPVAEWVRGLGTKSSQTLRWRKRDSNPRSLTGRGRSVSRRFAAQRCRRTSSVTGRAVIKQTSPKGLSRASPSRRQR
jgi:hypothetical protein